MIARRKSRTRGIISTFVVVIAGASIVSAAAADLGGLNVGQISAFSTEVSIEVPDPPGPIVETDFSGCINFIDGWTDESGHTWTSHSGRWQCLGNDVVRAQQRVPFANLTVPIGQSTGISVSAHLFDISHQNNRSGPGISLLNDGAGSFAYVMYRRDDNLLIIGIRQSGSDIPVFQITPPFSDLDSGTMVVELNGTVFDVTFGGVDFGAFDLAQAAPLLANERFGLISDNDNFSRFDSFRIEALP